MTTDQPAESDALPTLTAEQVPGSEAWVIRADGQLWAVASVSGGTVGAERLARLFAAAPDVLATLQELWSTIEGLDYDAYIGNLRDFGPDVESAIRKATGAE